MDTANGKKVLPYVLLVILVALFGYGLGAATIYVTEGKTPLLGTNVSHAGGTVPEEVVATALETLAERESTRCEEQERHQAVQDMLAFASKHHFTLGEGLRIRDLIHEDHKY